MEKKGGEEAGTMEVKTNRKDVGPVSAEVQGSKLRSELEQGGTGT